MPPVFAVVGPTLFLFHFFFILFPNNVLLYFKGFFNFQQGFFYTEIMVIALNYLYISLNDIDQMVYNYFVLT